MSIPRSVEVFYHGHRVCHRVVHLFSHFPLEGYRPIPVSMMTSLYTPAQLIPLSYAPPIRVGQHQSERIRKDYPSILLTRTAYGRRYARRGYRRRGRTTTGLVVGVGDGREVVSRNSAA